MLERNILSHLKLALLLSLLSSAILLHARLPSPSDADSGEQPSSGSKAGLPMAALEIVAALAVIAAGVWEYWCGERDLRSMRAFLVADKPHKAILTFVSGIVLTTCIILLVDESDL